MRLCVILFIMWYLVIVLDINDVFQIYILSFDYLKEKLLLLIMECSIYVSIVVEYIFSFNFRCLSLSLYLYVDYLNFLNYLF